jgi:hypothetical protein
MMQHMTRRRQTGGNPAPNDGQAALSGRTERLPVVSLLLALGWFAVPAIQYIGADQRMRLITAGDAPLAGLALTDFTVAYLLLLLSTLGMAAQDVLRRRDQARKS